MDIKIFSLSSCVIFGYFWVSRNVSISSELLENNCLCDRINHIKTEDTFSVAGEGLSVRISHASAGNNQDKIYHWVFLVYKIDVLIGV